MHCVEAKTILHRSGNGYGINVYRGCTHGCVYCDSRSRCYRMDHAFEDIEAKINAPALLEQALRAKRKRCVIGTGSMSDPWQPAEEELRLTRKCLEVIRRFGFGAAVQTKSDRILEDKALLAEIHENAGCTVQVTLTTWDEDLCRLVEPDVCTTQRRVEVLETFRELGVPTIVWISPLLPFINDREENLTAILKACRETGVKGIVCFGIGLTLRDGNREYYYDFLDRHFPGLKAEYIKRYGSAYEVPSPESGRLETILHRFCEENGMLHTPEACFSFMERMPERYVQACLWDG